MMMPIDPKALDDQLGQVSVLVQGATPHNVSLGHLSVNVHSTIESLSLG
jgi:hypothetical protein